LLVHGIWSSGTTWDNFNPLINDARFLVRRANYPNDREFAVGASSAYDQLKACIIQYKTLNKVAAIQADVVTHSMGGPVIRTITLQQNYLNDSLFPTFGKGPIRRLITIDSVHLGTRFANLLLNNQCVADIFTNDFGQPTGNGAVSDLAEGSLAIQRINGRQTPFGVHTVVGLASGFQKNVNGLGIQWRVDRRCRGNVFTGFDDVVGPENDLLVSGASQRGGRAANSATVTQFQDRIHSAPFVPAGARVLDSMDIAQRVIDLLNTNDSTLFNRLP
jgi:hypothetical protein